MSGSIRQQIQAHLSNPKQLEAFLADVRRGAALRPSDLDILQALRSLSVLGCRMDAISVPVLEAIRSAAITSATARVQRRREVARRQRQRTQAKLRQSDYERRLLVSPLSPLSE